MAFQYTPLDVEYCEVNDKGYCGWSCLPGTIVVQEAGGLTLEFADKSRLTCGYDRVRPKPPKSTLPSTKVGQVVEFKDGDWWRTAVCARDVELLPDNDQQITKVVLPDTLNAKDASSGSLRPCLTYTPGNPEPWQPTVPVIADCVFEVATRVASLKDKDGNYAKFGFKGISETQAPDAAPLQASLGQPPTQQPPPPLQQLWATRRPDKEKRKKHVTLRPRLQTIYMVLAARGYDLLMGECINFGDVLWRKMATHLDLTDDQQPKLVTCQSTSYMGPETSSCSSLATGGRTPGGGANSQGGASKRHNSCMAPVFPDSKRSPSCRPEQQGQSGPGSQGRFTSRHSRQQVPFMQQGGNRSAGYSQSAPGSQPPPAPRPQSLPPPLPRAQLVSSSGQDRPAAATGAAERERLEMLMRMQALQASCTTTVNSSSSLSDSGHDGGSVRGGSGAAAVRNLEWPAGGVQERLAFSMSNLSACESGEQGSRRVQHGYGSGRGSKGPVVRGDPPPPLPQASCRAGVGQSAADHHASQQQQQQQPRRRPPVARNLASFLPAEGSSLLLWVPVGGKDPHSTPKPLIVRGKLGSGGQAVVLHVTELPHDGHPALLPTASLAAGKPAMPAMDQCGPSSAAAAGAGSSKGPSEAHRALKVSLPWELSQQYTLDRSLEGRQEYLQRANKYAEREQRYINQLHAGGVTSGSEHIIDCYARGWVQLPGCDYTLPALLLEYCEGGSLQDKEAMDAATAACYLSQVASGLIAMNKHQLIHSDVKAGNCLLDSRGKVKLCDFGLVRDYSEGLPLSNGGYTPSHMAPEQKPGCFFDRRVDTFGLGCLLLELRFKALPFLYLVGRPDEEARRNDKELDDPLSDYYGKLEPEEKRLAQVCLKDQTNRPYVSLLREWFADYFQLAEEAA